MCWNPCIQDQYREPNIYMSIYTMYIYMYIYTRVFYALKGNIYELPGILDGFWIKHNLFIQIITLKIYLCYHFFAFGCSLFFINIACCHNSY